MNDDIRIIVADWDKHGDALLSVRRTVFIEEQRVPESLDLDGEDETSFHVLALASVDKQPVGTARLMSDGRIGRVAVLPPFRMSRVGSRLMTTLLALAREQDYEAVYLHAQTVSLRFYEKLGFEAEGEEFEEAGIPHFEMKLSLKKKAAPKNGAA